MKYLIIFATMLLTTACSTQPLRGTGDLGVIIERAIGRVQIVEHSHNTSLAKVEGLGDLSHASLVFSRDARYAYIFGRDGGLTKVDLLTHKIAKRVMQAGNSIGGAISQDGKLIAVANYTPGGVKIFSADSLDMVADIPAVYGDNLQSKTVGLIDIPDQKFVVTLYDAGEIWIINMQNTGNPAITKFKNIGALPYDALLTPDGHYYIAGLFGEDGMALLDLWHPENGVKRILNHYGRGREQLPVFKMPHLEGWTTAGDKIFMPAVGQHEVLIADKNTWQQVGSIAVHGQPIFVIARPDNRHLWVNFAHPNNDTLQVIDVETQQIIKTITPGKAVLHMEFTPRGDQIWVSVRDEDRVDIYDTRTFEKIGSLPVDKPSGIFFSNRAHQIGL
jgi:protein NirF